MTDTDPRCETTSQANGRRCDLPKGHEGLHSLIDHWTEKGERCDAPLPVYGQIVRSHRYAPTAWSGERYDITVELPSGRKTEFLVIGPELQYGSLSEPAVNWSALGSCSLEDTKAFAEALSGAAELASRCAGPDASEPDADAHGPGCDGPLNCTCPPQS